MISGISKGGKGGRCVDEVFLNPGEFCFCGEHALIKTLLGSCVAITLWHPALHIGGMCHFVLPQKIKSNESVETDCGRYCTGAMALFKAQAQKRTTQLCDYQAKIFGGSNMLAKSTQREDDLIGKKNTDAAMAVLAEHNIPLMLAHVGETGFRRIVFEVATGDVWVWHEPLEKCISSH